MKHINHFNDFMKNTVNLNQSRIDTLKNRVDTIEKFLKTSSYGATIRRFNPQGSWAHKTIIKPPNDRQEFDADLVVFVNENRDWEPKDYVENIYRVFQQNGIYCGIAKRSSRCVVLDYANDFHLDVIPCIQRETSQNSTTFYVTNRKTNEEEETASENFTSWLNRCNSMTGGNMLLKVIRLLKYQRDIKTTFSAKSILLTTLLGTQVLSLGQTHSQYSDLPTTLKSLINRLDDWLQTEPCMPTITNPVLPSEDFNRHWDQQKYNNFREKINKYRGWIDDAYQETNRYDSLRKWRKLLGDAFAKDEVIKAAASANTSLTKFTSRTRGDLVENTNGELTDFTQIPFWPHAQKPKWRMARSQIYVNVSATFHSSKNALSLGNLDSGQSLSKDRHICFMVSPALAIPATFMVKWRVVNSGLEACNADQIRGGFEDSHAPKIRWEHTKYHGIHWVEAFVINTRTNECMGNSKRFFVVVE